MAWIFRLTGVIKKKIITKPLGEVYNICAKGDPDCENRCRYTEASCSLWTVKDLGLKGDDNGFVVTNLPTDVIIFEKKPKKISSQQVMRTLRQLPKIQAGLPQKFREGKILSTGMDYRTADRKHQLFELVLGIPRYVEGTDKKPLMDKVTAITLIVADGKLISQVENNIPNDPDGTMSESDWAYLWHFYSHYLSLDKGKTWYKLEFSHGSECINWDIKDVAKGGAAGHGDDATIQSRSFCTRG